MDIQNQTLILCVIFLFISLVMLFAQIKLFSINKTLQEIYFELIKNSKGKNNTRKCSFCAEVVKQEAIICKHCRSDLTEDLKVEYWPNGKKKSEAKYKLGKLHGIAIYWYENGEKKNEIEYKAGRLNGKYTEWDESGKKTKEIEFNDDEMTKDYFSH